MTDQSSQFPRFYVTAPSPCPYIDGRWERKIFTELSSQDTVYDFESALSHKEQQRDCAKFHDSLTHVGFRRSQDISYRPACEDCNACQSVRLPVDIFTPNRTQRRLQNLNSDLVVSYLANEITPEQFDLLQDYLSGRHPSGGMTDMSYDEYGEMVELSPIHTQLVEYRLKGKLIGMALTDQMGDGFSMVYSFFDISPEFKSRSLGTYIILNHIQRAQDQNLTYIYLGYLVEESPKMAYKKNFRPLEILGSDGWVLHNK